MGTALVVTSGKGGVGKTTSSANIGTALACKEKGSFCWTLILVCEIWTS